jgi:DNA repair protein RecN (Recombination protein N)
MERTRFDVRFAAGELGEDRWGPTGIDAAEFFVSPNPGEELRPLTRVVSGGELSRIMLAIKTLTGVSTKPAEAAKGPLPGMVFDEVDAGIGGRVADVIGRKLRALGARGQVLCITHLPQIAAHADTHFHVAKDVERGRTHVSVHRLDRDGRIAEIGRMLGGAQVTDGIRASACEMLESRAWLPRSEPKPKGESERAKAKGQPGRRRPGRRASTDARGTQ